MSYQLNLPGMFAVPNAVADEHLKLARELPLKVLLWILRRGGEVEGLEALAGWLGRPEGELVEAVQFWIDRGVLTMNNEQCTMNNLASEPVVQAIVVPAGEPVKRLTPEPVTLPPVRPTAAQLLTRMDEDPGLRELFSMADRLLGRTIGYEGQCMLLLLHDTYGLPVDVIYMLLHYCAEAGKTSNGYIEAMGCGWGRREIDTIEKAGEEIAALKDSKTLWSELRRRAGISAAKPTAAQNEYLRRWSKELGYGIEMIFAAYEEMANNTGKLSFSYMAKVLDSWHGAGLRTPEEAAAFKAEYQKTRQRGGAGKKSGKAAAATGYSPSFDLDAFERSTLEVPVFEK